MLSDGGEVALDWAESKEGGVGKLNFESPVMLILPGIVGEWVSVCGTILCLHMLMLGCFVLPEYYHSLASTAINHFVSGVRGGTPLGHC